MIRVDINDRDAMKLLNELRSRMGDIPTVMGAVGQIYLSGAQQRFVDQRDPQGQPWKPLSPVTLARRRKAGRGAQILRDTGVLMNSLSYKTAGNTVTVFTSDIRAGTHQYGAKKGQYGRSRRGPIPWGDIPARPFLGINQQDNDAVLEVLNGYLQADKDLSWWRRLVDRLRGRRR